MSTLSVVKQPPSQQASQEATSDSPQNGQDQYADILKKYGQKLIALDHKIRESWAWKRRGIVREILENKEMLKGNHNIGFYPDSADSFDALDQFQNFVGSNNKENGDLSIDRRPHNFYQMLESAYEAALSAEVPKTRAMPANADVEEDRATAKAFDRVMKIIERANKIRGLVKQELQELFTAGAYFKYTRYVVDADRTGTHKETTLQVMASDVVPPRYVCFQCGATTPESELVTGNSLTCPMCGAPLGPQNYFEEHVDQVPVAEEQSDVANGMVLWNIYSGIHVDADPDSPDLLNTRLLNVSEEVALGWLRQTFKDHWDKFQLGQSSGASNEQTERLYRDLLTTPGGYGKLGQTSQAKPTYARTWFQPMAFAEMESRADAEALTAAFPQGCTLAYVGQLALQIRPAKLTKEWTWCGSRKGYGLFPAPVGKPAVPIQQRINDCVNKIDDYMDRLACGILLANSLLIDSKAMNGKLMLPGVLNPVAFRKGTPASDIQHAIFQLKAEIDQHIFAYVSTLKQDMELLVGTPPQTFGAGTTQGVETMGGQKQQLDTGMMKMGLTWDHVREEHAEAAENAVECAGKNMTEDWQTVVTDETQDFRNEYVHLDQMKGSVHAEPEADQGFPMTYAEIKSFWQDVLQNADKQLAQWLMSVPENVENALRYIGVPGLVAPGASMREKMLHVIDQLIQTAPVQQPDPVSGQPVMVPSLQPIILDDLAASQVIIENYTAEHWDKLESNVNGLDNLMAYYKACIVMDKEKQAMKQLMAPQPQGATQ